MLVGAVQLRMLASWGGGKVEFFFGNIAFKFKFTSITCISSRTNIRLNGDGVSSILPIPN